LLDGRVRNYNEVLPNLEFNLTVNSYLCIRRAVVHGLVARAAKDSNLTVVEVQAFINKCSRGAKRYRKILEFSKHSTIRGTNITKTFCTLVNIPNLEPALGGQLLGTWSLTCLPIALRTFSFQLYNNSLPMAADWLTGTVIIWLQSMNHVHSVALVKWGSQIGSSFYHLFYTCPFVADTVNRFRIKYVPADFTEIERT
jgi:hypothetical protein